MSSQEQMMLSRAVHVRELKAEIARLREENSRLRDAMASLNAHFSLALTALEDARRLPEGGRIILVDGWNAILGAKKEARSRGGLIEKWRGHLESFEKDFVWIIFDGPVENVVNEERLRVSYTGGKGPHRADRFICDYLRAARYLGCGGRIEVKTNDRGLVKEAAGLV